MSPRVRDAAEEPSAAAGPHGTLVAAWIQDLANGVTAAYKTKGGRHWTRKRFPFGGCNVNRDFGSDPWVSVGPDGRAWVSALEAQGVVVTSLDANQRNPQWTAPHIFPGTARRADKPEIVADPTRSGLAYIVWSWAPLSRRDHFGILFSRSVNAGKTWTKAVPEISRPVTPEAEFGEVGPDRSQNPLGLRLHHCPQDRRTFRARKHCIQLVKDLEEPRPKLVASTNYP